MTVSASKSSADRVIDIYSASLWFVIKLLSLYPNRGLTHRQLRDILTKLIEKKYVKYFRLDPDYTLEDTLKILIDWKLIMPKSFSETRYLVAETGLELLKHQESNIKRALLVKDWSTIKRIATKTAKKITK